MSVLKLKSEIVKLCILLLVPSVLFICCKNRPLYAASALKTISGQAVLTDGVEKARQESISDALGEVLRNYIYGDMAVNHKFEPQIDATILKNRNFFIKKFEIKNERTLGELYQIELLVELKSELIESELKKIEHLKKHQVKTLQLVVLPPGVSSDHADSEIGNESDDPLTSILEPTTLNRELQQGLTVYGFTLSGSGKLAPELEEVFIKLMDTDDPGSREKFNASWFHGFMNADLAVVIRPAGVREERLLSLNKSFWHGQADIIFIDMKNNTITRLPTSEAKVISSDYITGMERLTRELSARVRKNVTGRLLRDYVVPGGEEAHVVLRCTGFRRPADFMAFKEHLKSLQTVKSISLQKLSAGFLELDVTTLTSAELLLKWINNFTVDGLPYHLQATAFPPSTTNLEPGAALDSSVVSPAVYLVEATYGVPNGL